MPNDKMSAEQILVEVFAAVPTGVAGIPTDQQVQWDSKGWTLLGKVGRAVDLPPALEVEWPAALKNMEQHLADGEAIITADGAPAFRLVQVRPDPRPVQVHAFRDTSGPNENPVWKGDGMVALGDALGDDIDGLRLACTELVADGETIIGGGAAPALRLVADPDKVIRVQVMVDRRRDSSKEPAAWDLQEVTTLWAALGRDAEVLRVAAPLLRERGQCVTGGGDIPLRMLRFLSDGLEG